MKYSILLLIAVTITKTCLCQTSSLNHQKYQFYNQRLKESFVVNGINHGESLPFSTRRHQLIDDNTYYNNTYTIYSENILTTADNPIQLSMYLAVLSTEIRLKQMHLKDYSQTLIDLCYALDALNRLDAMSDHLMGTYGVPPNLSSAQFVLDGFFLRDDIPRNFLSQHPELIPGNYCRFPVDVNTGDYALYGWGCLDEVSRNEFSKDHLYWMLSGLTIALKSIDPNLIMPVSQGLDGTFMDGQSNIREEIKAILNRIYGYNVLLNNFLIINPLCNECARSNNQTNDPCGIGMAANMIEMGYPLSWFGYHWLDYDQNINALNIGIALAQYNLWQFFSTNSFQNAILNSNDPEDKKDACREMKHVTRMAALTQSWNLSNSICAELTTVDFLVNPLQNAIEPFHVWPIVGNSGLWPACVPLSELFIPAIGNYHENRLKEISHEVDKNEIQYLIHCFLFDKVPDLSFADGFDFQDLLNSAPCEGPFNFSRQALNGHPIHPDDPNWAWNNRWDNFSDKYYTILSDNSTANDFNDGESEGGEYNGLDYMLVFNLYCLVNPSYCSDYGSNSELIVITGQLPVPPNDPINCFPCIANKGYSVSYDRLEADATLLPGAWVHAKAVNEIELKHGFEAHPGSYFTGIIGIPECSSGFYKNHQGHANSNPISQSASLNIQKPIKTNGLVYNNLNNKAQKENHSVPEKGFSLSSPGFIIYPNPANESIQLIIANKKEAPNQITIFNNPGQVLYETSTTANKLSVPVESFAEGHYFIQVRNESGQWVKPLVVKR